METQRGTGLTRQLAEVKVKVDGMFSNLKREGYRLFSVLVHDGKAGSGHYWAYIQRQDDSWVKFSDADVSPVAEEEVWKMSVGGHATTSAYCLMYRRSDIDNSASSLLPAAVKLEVEGDNAKLAEECVAWDAAQTLETFSSQFRKAVADADTGPSSTSVDGSLSFERFLHTANEGLLMRHLISKEVAARVYGSAIDNQLQTKLNEATNEASVPLNEQQAARLEELRTTYLTYLSTSVAVVEASVARQDGGAGGIERGLVLLASALRAQYTSLEAVRKANVFREDLLPSFKHAQEEVLNSMRATIASLGTDPSASLDDFARAYGVVCQAGKALTGLYAATAVIGVAEECAAMAEKAVQHCRTAGVACEALEGMTREAAAGFPSIQSPEAKRVSWEEATDVLSRLQGRAGAREQGDNPDGQVMSNGPAPDRRDVNAMDEA
ncbi:hypothetical protein T484DRAFT_2884857 [Baffinella frigidus]|nr:hypothetical protein T484DRAFT_2884857 [Cryptophyta sp. CCMP2293]